MERGREKEIIIIEASFVFVTNPSSLLIPFDTDTETDVLPLPDHDRSITSFKESSSLNAAPSL
jgi:hypothetical protein